MAFTKLCTTFTIFINLALCVITHDQMALVADLDKGPLSENTLEGVHCSIKLRDVSDGSRHHDPLYTRT
jgi:hypothetical protein